MSPFWADTVEKHIVLVFSGSSIRPEWRDVRDHVWSGLSNVGALQRTCGTIYLRTSDAACLGKISRDAQLWSFSTISAQSRRSNPITRFSKAAIRSAPEACLCSGVFDRGKEERSGAVRPGQGRSCPSMMPPMAARSAQLNAKIQPFSTDAKATHAA